TPCRRPGSRRDAAKDHERKTSALPLPRRLPRRHTGRTSRVARRRGRSSGRCNQGASAQRRRTDRVMTPLEATITAVATRCLQGSLAGRSSSATGDFDTPFELLGLDSLATIELAAALEDELGCELPAD